MAYLSTNEYGLESKFSRKRNQAPFSYLLVLVYLAFPLVSLAQSTGSDENNNRVLATKAQPGGDAPHVKLRLTETVSSADAKVGQLISIEVVDSVQIDGKVIIAAGAHARASVISAKRRGRNHREGQLVLTVESVSRVDGRETLLQSANVQTGAAMVLRSSVHAPFPYPLILPDYFEKGTMS